MQNEKGSIWIIGNILIYNLLNINKLMKREILLGLMDSHKKGKARFSLKVLLIVDI